jgi:hypothetical protein
LFALAPGPFAIGTDEFGTGEFGSNGAVQLFASDRLLTGRAGSGGSVRKKIKFGLIREAASCVRSGDATDIDR